MSMDRRLAKLEQTGDTHRGCANCRTGRVTLVQFDDAEDVPLCCPQCGRSLPPERVARVIFDL